MKPTSLLPILCLFVLGGCRRELDRVVLTPNALTLTEVAANTGITAEFFDNAGQAMPPQPVTFTSSAPDVVTVDHMGWVTAGSTGSATITATSGDKKGTATVDVTYPTRLVVQAGSQRLVTRARTGEALAVTDRITLPGIGAQLKLEGSLTDDLERPVRPTTLVLGVRDPALVTIENDGTTLTARGYGQTLVSAAFELYTAAFFLTIAPPPTLTIQAPASLSLKQGQTQAVPAKLGGLPAGVPITGLLAYKSSDLFVATVDSSGRLTAQHPGQTELTISAGEKKATVKITVTGGPTKAAHP